MIAFIGEQPTGPRRCFCGATGCPEVCENRFPTVIHVETVYYREEEKEPKPYVRHPCPMQMLSLMKPKPVGKQQRWIQLSQRTR